MLQTLAELGGIERRVERTLVAKNYELPCQGVHAGPGTTHVDDFGLHIDAS